MKQTSDEYFMDLALREARKALKRGEVPVGAVIVHAGRVVGRGYNRGIMAHDPSAHAEMVALRAAGRRLKAYRLTGSKLYVTIEPCPMCAGALVWARVAEVVYGAADPKAGACGSVMNVTRHRKLNHRVTVTGGIREDECRRLIQDFFKQTREQKRNRP